MRRSNGGKPRLTMALMAALIAMLPLLAVLQYRWIGQISQAEHDRLQSGLRTAAARFAMDFNGELVRLFMALMAGRPAGPGEELATYAERFANWSAATHNPNLVRDYYVAFRSEPGILDRLYRLNRSRGEFEPAAWPPQFRALRERLETQPPGFFRPFGEALDQEIPALVAPLVRMRDREMAGSPGPERRRMRTGPEPGEPMLARRRMAPAGWSIVELNLEFIRNEFFPELVERHFAGAEGRDYQVQIVDKRDPHRVIYESDPGLFTTADAQAALFELRPENPVGPPAAGGFLWRQFSGAGPRGPGNGPPPGMRPPERGGWQLMVRHRAGSLEAAVAGARRRNLAVSFAILVVMSAAIMVLLISTGRAQRLARLQMQFVAGVSHELRTPLTVICSAADNLSDGLVSSTDQVRRYGGVIRSEGRRLADMVDQILGFAGAQSGKAKYEFQPVEISSVVEQAVTVCEPEARQAGCQVETCIDPDLPPVQADPVALMHCLRNLVSNAIKYAGESGWIRIRVEREEAPRGTGLRISVEDRGPGIDPADLPHIFEPFYRGRGPVAAQIHGAGLGLSLVRHIMHAHGGSVEVDRAPRTGACFILHLPLPAMAAALEQVK